MAAMSDRPPSISRARELAAALLSEIVALRAGDPAPGLDLAAAEQAARDCAGRLAAPGYIDPPRPD